MDIHYTNPKPSTPPTKINCQPSAIFPRYFAIKYLNAYLPYVLHDQYISSVICLPNTVYYEVKSKILNLLPAQFSPAFFFIFVEYYLL